MLRAYLVGDDPLVFLEKQVDIMADAWISAGRQAYDESQPDFDVFKREPRTRSYPGDYPYEFESVKQRRYVMRLLKSTGRFPFRRTHQLAAAWRYGYTRKQYTATYTIENPSEEASYVYGSSDVNAPLRSKQRAHGLTGWHTAMPEVQVFFEKVAQRTYAIYSENVRKA